MGLGSALPFSCPRNAARQAYTLPKNGLEAALSAQICSWSENCAEFCLDAMTGGIQALAFPAAAARTSSVRDTAMASNPLNVSPGVDVGKRDVRLALYRREP